MAMLMREEVGESWRSLLNRKLKEARRKLWFAGKYASWDDHMLVVAELYPIHLCPI